MRLTCKIVIVWENVYYCDGGVPELADGLDLGSSAAMRGGSSPPFPTWGINRRNIYSLHLPSVKRRGQIIVVEHGRIKAFERSDN